MISFSFSSDKGGAGGISSILHKFINTFSLLTFLVLMHIPGVGVTYNVVDIHNIVFNFSNKYFLFFHDVYYKFRKVPERLDIHLLVKVFDHFYNALLLMH